MVYQAHYAAFQARALAENLSRRDYVEPEEDLGTYEKMHARIDQALLKLDKTDKTTVNSLGETITQYNRRDEAIEIPIKALGGLLNMPNIYFHVSMAYAILRKEGVPLEKRDWSRGILSDYI